MSEEESNIPKPKLEKKRGKCHVHGKYKLILFN